jgi:hypothetical protein
MKRKYFIEYDDSTFSIEYENFQTPHLRGEEARGQMSL